MQQDMTGRVALITGAGNGIGRATARQMAARGAIVAVNDLKSEFVDAVVNEITASGGKAFGVVQNISSREGIAAAVQQARDYVGRFDILVNNAAWVRYQAVPDVQCLPGTILPSP